MERLCSTFFVELGVLQNRRISRRKSLIKKTGTYIECEYCGKTVYKTPYQYSLRKHHFCSNKCQALRKQELTYIHKPCEWCGKDMYLPQSSTKRFCSNECQHVWQKENVGMKNKRFGGGYVRCECCGTMFLVGKYIFEDNRHHFCSTRCRQEWYAKTWSQSYEWKRTSRERAVNILSNHLANTQSKPQIAINNILDRLGIEYRNEEPFKYYAVDNYLTSYNLIIEVMGDYWHGSPLKYPSSLSNKQRKTIVRDKAKRTFIKNRFNIDILYLWESDINKRPFLCEKLILKYINTNGLLPNYHSFNYTYSNDEISLNTNIVYPYQERNNSIAC